MMVGSLRYIALFTALAALGMSAGCNGDDDGAGGGVVSTSTPTMPMPATPTPTTAPPPVSPPAAAGAGLESQISDARVVGDQVVVTFTLTDGSGAPLTPSLGGTSDPQRARVRFALAHIEQFSGGGEFQSTTFNRYVNDVDATRPRYDSNGTLTTIDGANGVYQYAFNTRLPEGFDTSATYAVGIQVDRTFEGSQLGVNPVFDFVPGGGVPVIRAGSTTAQCNQCHDPLQLHGNRREFRLCALCHNGPAVDELGRSIDLQNMIHKIHRGKDLPSIVDGEPGSTYAIFSSFAQEDVVFAQKDLEGNVTGIAFPRTLRDCDSCHAGGATAGNYLTKPSTAACAACHDNVNPSLQETDAGPPGTGHFQSRGFAEGDCAFCHEADSGREFDISVAGAHTIPERSRQLAGLVVEILGLSNHGPAQSPTIEFKVSDDDGNALENLSGLNRLAFTASGPTTDYGTLLTATAVGGGASGTLSGPDSEGIFAYTPAFTLPATAEGTWALGAEARRQVILDGEEGEVEVEEAAANPVVTFTVGDSESLVRRMVVADENCQSCHGEFSREFSIHGNLRNRVEYCVICHNPTGSDVSRRRRDADAVERGDQNETIDFKRMIHKIHTGEELENKPYIIYGFGAPPANFTAIDFSEVLYPGDRRNCEACHLEGTYLIPPFPGTALPTQLTRLDPLTGDTLDDGQIGPINSVCTSCHDGNAAVAHAETQTATNGDEACTVCHSEGRDVPVSEAHAR